MVSRSHTVVLTRYYRLTRMSHIKVQVPGKPWRLVSFFIRTPNATDTGSVLQDAYILYTVLSHRSTHHGNVERALSIYDAIRRPAALRVQERSRLAGQYFTFSNEGMPCHLDRMLIPWICYVAFFLRIHLRFGDTWCCSIRRCLEKIQHERAGCF